MRNQMRPEGSSMKKTNASFKRKQNLPLEGDVFKCPVCGYIFSSIRNLRIHYRDTNHKALDVMTSNMLSNAACTIPEHIRSSIVTVEDYVRRVDREPIVGLDYVLEYRVQVSPVGMETKYFCGICESDYDLIPMLEHLSSFRHRKLYLGKEYPYVLKAPSGGQEDRTRFLRRMAAEIEQEEGTKMHKADPVPRAAPMTSVASRRKTRWDSEGDRQRRMKKALDYLDSFEIDNDAEAATVTRLAEKMTAELKFYSDKLKEEALFPAKVARAKEVAMSMMRDSAKTQDPVKTNPTGPRDPVKRNLRGPQDPVKRNLRGPQNPVKRNQRGPQNPVQRNLTGPQDPVKRNQRGPQNPVQRNLTGPQNPVKRNPRLNAPPAFNKEPPDNMDFNNLGAPGGTSQHNNPYWVPNTALPLRPPESQYFHQNQRPQSQASGNVPKDPTSRANLEPQMDQSDGDLKFFKKLKTLLAVLPQDATRPDSSQLDSKLLMLKRLLLDNTANSKPANQVTMQVASLSQDMSSTEKVSLNQQLTITSSKNTASTTQFSQNVSVQMASSAAPGENTQGNQNLLMRLAALLQNRKTNAGPMLPDNQNVQSQDYLQADDSSMMLMEQNAYEQPGYGSSQGDGDFGYDGSTAGSYGNAYMNQHDDFAQSMDYVSGEPTGGPYGDMTYDSGSYSAEWDQSAYSDISKPSANPGYDDYAAEQAPYTRVRMSPSNKGSENERFQDDRFLELIREIRSRDKRPGHGARSSRSSDDPSFEEKDIQYGKRVKLDRDHVPSQRKDPGKPHHEEDAANLSADILKRIRGKDLFTVSAILSEYAEGHSSK